MTPSRLDVLHSKEKREEKLELARRGVEGVTWKVKIPWFKFLLFCVEVRARVRGPW